MIETIDGGLPLGDAKRLMIQLLLALNTLHHANIIHTDVKTHNLNITKRIADIQTNNEISIVLTDLGSSTLADSLFSLHTGTQEYMAPELIVGAKYTAAIDIWSAMCVYYELITGDLLFELPDSCDDDLSADKGNATAGDTDSITDTALGDIDTNITCLHLTNESFSSSGDGEATTTLSNKMYDLSLGLIQMAQIEGLIGSAPKWFSKGDKLGGARDFYNIKGKLKADPTNGKPPIITKWTISQRLTSLYEFTVEEAAAAEEFMLLGLKFNPADRWTADRLLKHPYLTGK